MCLPRGSREKASYPSEGGYRLHPLGRSHTNATHNSEGVQQPPSELPPANGHPSGPPLRFLLYLVLVLRCCYATSFFRFLGSLLAPRGLSGGGRAAAFLGAFRAPAGLAVLFCADQYDCERQSKKGLSIRQRKANRTDQHHQPPERQAIGKATATGLDKGD